MRTWVGRMLEQIKAHSTIDLEFVKSKTEEISRVSGSSHGLDKFNELRDPLLDPWMSKAEASRLSGGKDYRSMHRGRKATLREENLGRNHLETVTLFGRECSEGKYVGNRWLVDRIVGKESFTISERTARESKSKAIGFTE